MDGFGNTYDESSILFRGFKAGYTITDTGGFSSLKVVMMHQVLGVMVHLVVMVVLTSQVVAVDQDILTTQL